METKESEKRADVVVYGGTPAGIATACVASGEGARVILVEPGKQVGGHLTSGICTTECEHMLPVSFSGWMMDFLGRLGRWYGLAGPAHRWEPHAALSVYDEMLSEAGVEVIRGERLSGVKMARGRIESVTVGEGRAMAGRIFVDAGYEGDLMAMAGVPYAVGRESTAEYGESLAGMRFIDSLEEVKNSKGHAYLRDEVWEMDLRAEGGGLVDLVTPCSEAELERGRGDGKVMNYHYRVTVTRAADRIPFARPAHYREERFALLSRYLHRYPETPLEKIVGFLKHPSGKYLPSTDGMPGYNRVEPGDKWELNNVQASVLSLGHLGGQFGYPDGTAAEREAILEDHYNHNAGLLYFLSNSADVPASLRESAREWGLPPDEYVDNGHWPYQPYIRETRRMQGAYVLTQKDVLEEREKADGIFWNSHWIDCHHVQRLALDEWHFRNEGRIWRELVKPYAIPYRSLLPKGEDCENLIVPGCVSSSHVAYCSVRLESSWMGLGEAAGVASVMALGKDCPVQEVAAGALQERLRERGVYLPERV